MNINDIRLEGKIKFPVVPPRSFRKLLLIITKLKSLGLTLTLETNNKSVKSIIIEGDVSKLYEVIRLVNRLKRFKSVTITKFTSYSWDEGTSENHLKKGK